MWRLVLRKVATLAEIEDGWSLCDVADANEALDVDMDVDEWNRARKRAEAEHDAKIRKMAGMG